MAESTTEVELDAEDAPSSYTSESTEAPARRVVVTSPAAATGRR